MAYINCENTYYGVLPNRTPVKRPKKALTLAERISVIKMYESVRNTRKLAALFGCGRTQIQNILKRKEEYLSEWELDKCGNRMRIRNSIRLATLETILYEWVQRARLYSLQLTEEIVRQTGQEIASLIEIPDFQLTESWYSRMRQKYKMSDLGPNPFRNDGNVPKKSLNIKDIILDLKNPKCKNFVALPKSSAYDLLEDLTFDSGNEESRDCHESREVEIMYSSNSNDIEIDVMKVEEDCELDISNSVVGEIELSSFIQNIGHIENYGQEKEIGTYKANKGENPDYIDKCKAKQIISEHKTASLIAEMQSEYADIKQNDNTESLKSYEDAIKYLRPLEEFALYKTNIRAVGLINQLEILFKEKLSICEK